MSLAVAVRIGVDNKEKTLGCSFVFEEIPLTKSHNKCSAIAEEPPFPQV